MAFDYNLAASKYFIDRTADHHVVSVGNVTTNASGAISVSVAFNVDAEGKITYSEPQIYHKYTGDDDAKKNNLYKTSACLDADLVGTWANPTVGAKQTIDGKECEVIEILEPSANYEKFTLNNFGKFVLCKGVAGGMDTDAVAIDNASDKKDDDKVMTARAIEKSLAWENVNGKKGSIVSYIKNGETGAPDQPTVTGDYSLAFGMDAANEEASSTNGDKAIALNGAANGKNSLAINGVARGESAIAINGKAETDDNDAVDYAIAIGGEVVYDEGTPDEFRIANSAKSEGSIAIGAGARAYGNSDETPSIAIGKQAYAEGPACIAIGNPAEASYTTWTDPYDPSYTEDYGSIAINAESDGASVAIGSDANAYGVAVGYDNSCGENSVAVGYAVSSANYSIAIGNHLEALSDQAVIGVSNDRDHYPEMEDPQGWLTPIFTIANGNNVWTKDEITLPAFARPETDPNDPDYSYNAENSNALDVMANGDLYLMGIGGYNGQSLARQDVEWDDPDNPTIDPLTGRPIKLVKPVQDVIFEMQKKIEYLEGVIEHITEIINN